MMENKQMKFIRFFSLSSAEKKFDELKTYYSSILENFSEEDTDFDIDIDPMVENRGYDFFEIISGDNNYNLTLEIVCKEIQ